MTTVVAPSATHLSVNVTKSCRVKGDIIIIINQKDVGKMHQSERMPTHACKHACMWVTVLKLAAHMGFVLGLHAYLSPGQWWALLFPCEQPGHF